MTVTRSNAGAPSPEWVLLLYFLPAKRARARVQAWRRLQRTGAVSLKNSAYVLPDSAESREDFEWIRNEIIAGGGQAMVLVARASGQATDEEIANTFLSARTREFETLTIDASKLLKQATGKAAAGTRRQLVQSARRLRERFEEAARLDFFGASGREQVVELLAQLDQRTGRTKPMAPSSRTAMNAVDYRGKVWLTRPRPGVDRMASAWLIRRFIDSDATFVFSDPARTPSAIPFDTFDAEFGHHGSDCTFETLCNRFGITDEAVGRIGRMVHDLDLKENRYSEPETATIGSLVEGLRRAQPGDDVLLQSGIEMFEALYQSMTGAPSSLARKRRTTQQRGGPSAARQRTKRQVADRKRR